MNRRTGDQEAFGRDQLRSPHPDELAGIFPEEQNDS
jgi:hypothetical protein